MGGEMKVLKWIWFNVFWDKEGGAHWDKEQCKVVANGDFRIWGAIILLAIAWTFLDWIGWM
jgi:hypothetical protein